MHLDGVIRSKVCSFSGQAALPVQPELGKLRSGRTWQQTGLDVLCLTINIEREVLGLQMSCRVGCPGDLPWSGLPSQCEGKGLRHNRVMRLGSSRAKHVCLLQIAAAR